MRLFNMDGSQNNTPSSNANSLLQKRQNFVLESSIVIQRSRANSFMSAS
jgi:hypothetical protein